MDRDDILPTPDDLGFEGVTARYAELDGVSIDEDTIPEEFRHLVEYARFWSVMDESERADLMWLTPTEELEDFVNAAWPLMGRMNEWCNQSSHAVPMPDEVVLFQMMMTAAAEAAAAHVDPQT